MLFLSYSLENINKLNTELQAETLKIQLLLNRITWLHETFIRLLVKKNIIDSRDLVDMDSRDPNTYKALNYIYFGAKLDAYLMSDSIKCKN